MKTPVTESALAEFKSKTTRKGATETDLIEATNSLVQKMAQLERELTNWRYSHDEIECACGGETAQLVRAQVNARRVKIYLELAERADESANVGGERRRE